MDVPEELLVHTVQVETQVSTGPYGDEYAPPRAVACFIDDERRLIRNSNGAEVVSETTLICQLSKAAWFVIDSKVSLPDGREAYVQLVKRRDAGTLEAPSHLEVNL